MSDQMSVTGESLLRPEYVDAYKSQHKDIWLRLLRIEGSLTVMDRVSSFPFDLLVGRNEQGFWQLVIDNFGDQIVLLLHGLVSQDEGNQSLAGFANSISHWLKPEFQKDYNLRKKTAKFYEHTRDVANKIETLRHRIAHSRQTSERPFRPGVSREEIGRVFLRIKQLFGLVSLKDEYCIEYPGVDIDNLLDLIAKTSRFVNQPERHGAHWPGIRHYKKREELEKMNEWRAKFGLPEA